MTRALAALTNHPHWKRDTLMFAAFLPILILLMHVVPVAAGS